LVRVLALKRKLLVLGIIIMITSVFVKLEPYVKAQPGSEYQRYVHNYSNGTYIGKPMFPVLINDSQILMGQNWTIVCPLQANHSYHAYLYGAWVNNGSQPKTDYNIYVYDPNGALVGNHTESAGLLEHLGDTVDTPYFTPKQTGNYTFTIANNAGTSQAAQQATFMMIENIQTNTWHQQYIAGQVFGLPMFNTSWAYDFVTDSQHVEVQVKVPDTLDMYEARLYSMADPTVPNETILNGVPLAWEPGLYGNTTNATATTGATGTNATIGGYNLDAEGYRGIAYASCEYPGQDMLINHTSPHPGQTLYHLVLIGEYGAGTVDFLVKTIFGASLQPSTVPGKVYLDTNATIAYVSKFTDLLNATLQYSTDNWTSTTTIPMEILGDNRTCTAVIPAQAAGTLVSYRVRAFDYLEDALVVGGNYTVRQPSITFLAKPMFPVMFNDSQIELGRDWSVVSTLQANHSYHAYLYGAWVNNGSQPKTDYNVYVYDTNGILVGIHTQSAGLLEHLGDTMDTPFFTAESTGNYTFIIANEAGTSQAAQQATFMVIENIQTNTWHQQYIEGKDGNNLSRFNTGWAYDFVTDSQHVEVQVKVPDTLDMYEARLYVMADSTVANETILNGVPLAWEPGLYGNTTSTTTKTGTSGTNATIGGYNLDAEGYRGIAYASCEYPGQDMLINHTSPHPGQTLYHLVLIGEYGAGTVQYRVKTVFDAALLPSTVLDRVYPDTDVTFAYVSKSTDLLNATLQYSTDNWTSTTTIPIEISDDNRTCTGTIPRQAADTFVVFGVEAYDSLDNRLIAYENYTVIRSSTYLEKPMSPVWFDDSQIEIGRNWNVTCLLEANRTYHIYLYGAWVNNGSNPKTDYNVYVYDPYGNSESNHTASAGLLQHLGDTSDTPFFTPKYSGNYTFQIVNSAQGSVEAQQATFMIIEDVEPNNWNQRYIEGTNNGVQTLNTSWGYEFVTDSQNLQVLISVPDTLTMYEARLYPMADPTVKNETILDGVPLAWEPGLYGNTTSTTNATGATGTNVTIGGYNLDAEGYRGVAFATSDHAGQDMLINYTSSHAGQTLYHLVLIGGKGSGTVEFLVKTIFNASLQASIVPGRLYPNDTGLVAYVSTSTDLVNATLQYSTNNWANVTTIPMEILDNRTCRTTIPGQVAGTNVVYGIEATDLLTDILITNGSYTVKNPSMLNITLIRPTVTFGDNITVKGYINPQTAGMRITVYFDYGNDSESIVCFTLADGSFTASLTSNATGTWNVQAAFYEDTSTYGSMSQQLMATVEEPSFLAQYSLYIGLGVGAAAAGSAVLMLYLRKWRGRTPAEEEW
jgi:hypothetical protein